MASTLKHVDLTIPYKGLNTDVSPSQLTPEYTPSARNMVLSEPGQMRARMGWKRVASYATRYGVPTDAWLGNVVTLGDQFLVHGIEGQKLGAFYHQDFRRDIGGTSGTQRSTIVNADGTGMTAAVGSLAGQRGQFVGRTVQYDGSVYGTVDHYGTFPALGRWGGGNGATVTAGGVTLNNGAQSGTFSSAPAASQVNQILTVDGGATGPLAGYRFSYRIITHTAGAAAFTIDAPYGYGQNTTNVPNAVGATTTIRVESAAYVNEGTSTAGCAPNNADSVELFRDRLWVARRQVELSPSFDQYNVVSWSAVANPQYFPASNFVTIGEADQPIMGMATVGEGMLVFQSNRTWIITGYDESSFALNKISGEVGCIHSNSIVFYGGTVYWAGEKGFYRWNGGSIDDITSPAPGVGIKNMYQELTRKPDGLGTDRFNRVVGAGVIGENVVFSIIDTDNSAAAYPDCFAYNVPTGGWMRWGNQAQANGYNQPWFFSTVGEQTFAFTPWHMVNVTNIFSNENTANAVYQRYDEDYTSAGATVNNTITAELTFRDVRFDAANTTRVQGVQVEHNCHYYNTTSSPRVAWAVTLDYDSEIDTSSLVVGSVPARWIGNVSAPLYDKYYTERFTDSTFPTEGAVFRVKMVKAGASTVDSSKVFRVKLLAQGQATMLGRVNDATL